MVDELNQAQCRGSGLRKFAALEYFEVVRDDAHAHPLVDEAPAGREAGAERPAPMHEQRNRVFQLDRLRTNPGALVQADIE